MMNKNVDPTEFQCSFTIIDSVFSLVNAWNVGKPVNL